MKLEKRRCNICGSLNTAALGKRRGPDNRSDLEADIVRCLRCGLIYPDPMPVFADDEIQRNFSMEEAYFPDAVNDGRLARYDRLIRALGKYKPDKGDLLDVGCGRGELIHAAKNAGWEACGTEVSKDFARLASERFGIDVIMGDIKDIDFGPRRYDAVTLNSVIQYVTDPAGTLRKINRLLKDKGLLYIEVTNEDALVFTLGDLFKTMTGGRMITTRLSPLFPSFQIYGFNRKSIERALSGAGFRIRDLKVSGIRGGGRVKGRFFVDMLRKIIIAIGGLTGKGHLIYCIAEKERDA